MFRMKDVGYNRRLVALVTTRMSKAINADQRRALSHAGYFVGMLAGAFMFGFILAASMIDTNNLARDLVALPKLALLLSSVWIPLSVVTAFVGMLPFMAMRKFSPQNRAMRPLFILACFAVSWLFCFMVMFMLPSQFFDSSPYFPSPHPPILTQLRGLLTTTQSIPFICSIITGALVCWTIDARTKTNDALSRLLF